MVNYCCRRRRRRRRRRCRDRRHRRRRRKSIPLIMSYIGHIYCNFLVLHCRTNSLPVPMYPSQYTSSCVIFSVNDVLKLCDISTSQNIKSGWQ